MAKFDFNSSRYAKFFESKNNQRMLQSYLDTEGILYTNHGWYLTQGRKAGEATPVSTNGTATFTVKARALKDAPLMNLRAPLAAGMQVDQEGIEFYSATIPSFVTQNGLEEDAMQREDKVRRFEMFGNDADIVAAWTEKVQSMVDSADATMTYMTAKLMSTGSIDYTGIARGIQAPLHRANVPAANKTNAYGAKAWTDADALILTQMANIEDDFRQKWGYGGGLQWQFTRKFFRNVFLKNKEVQEFVNNYRYLNGLATTINHNASTTGGNLKVTPAMWAEAFTDYDGISSFSLVEEKERNLTNNNDTTVQGWSDNVAVLRPVGDAVEFEYTDNLDKQLYGKYGSSVINKVFASTNNGLGTLVNTTRNDGEFKKWSTDLFLEAVPALIDFPHHVIVNMATAKG